MICSTDESHNDDDMLVRQRKSRIKKIIGIDTELEERQKKELRELLGRFEKRKLKDEEFRILQGVLNKNNGKLEL